MREQFRKHMRDQHGQGWIRLLQNNILWTCCICNGVSPTEFQSVDAMTQDLTRHIHSDHSQSGDQEAALEIAQLSVSYWRRPYDTCPICGTCYRDDAETFVKVQQRPGENDDDAKTATTDGASEAGEEEVVDEVVRRQAEDCVANHMRDLSLQFTLSRLGQAAPPFSAPTSPRTAVAMTLPPFSERDDSGGEELDMSVDLFDPRTMDVGVRFEEYIQSLGFGEIH